MTESTATTGPRRSISAVVHREYVVEGGELQRRTVSTRTFDESSPVARRLSLTGHGGREYDRAVHLRRQSSYLRGGSDNTADLTSYYAFSRRRSSIVSEDQTGLSGFLEYHRMDGSWRSFLFQTIGFQLVVYRVHIDHQVQVMSSDIREATEIALVKDGDVNNTRVLRLGVNDTVITLRAVSHHAAMYWVEGLRQLKAGILPHIHRDRPTLESEDDIFRQIDIMADLREWRPPPVTEPTLCGMLFPCFGGMCDDPRVLGRDYRAESAALAVTHSPRPITR